MNKTLAYKSLPWLRIGLFVCLIALSAQITINAGDIPISGQSLVVLLIPFFLSTRSTFISIIIYLILGVIGLPIFADFSSGFSKLTGGSGGFLIGFLISAICVSYLYRLRDNNRFLNIIGLTALGTAILLLVGNMWLTYLYRLDLALVYGFYPFWKGAIIKILLGSSLVWFIKNRY